jgi:hypothetical protein
VSPRFKKIGTSDLTANVCANAQLRSGVMKAGGAVNPVAVHQSHSGHAVLGAKAGEFLGEDGGFEKAESGAGVELDEHRSAADER